MGRAGVRGVVLFFAFFLLGVVGRVLRCAVRHGSLGLPCVVKILYFFSRNEQERGRRTRTTCHHHRLRRPLSVPVPPAAADCPGPARCCCASSCWRPDISPPTLPLPPPCCSSSCRAAAFGGGGGGVGWNGLRIVHSSVSYTVCIMLRLFAVYVHLRLSRFSSLRGASQRDEKQDCSLPATAWPAWVHEQWSATPERAAAAPYGSRRT